MPRTSPHFTPRLFTYLRALDRSNTRDWFKTNRDRYIADARDPMLEFIEDMAPRLERLSSHFVADPSPTGGSMFRQHRDTRFSKDKRPYKTHVSAQFRHEAGRDVHAPGFYVHLGIGEVFVGLGIWHPDSESLGSIRTRIVEDAAGWRRVMRGRAFQDGTLALAGDALKRAPRGFDPDHPLVDDLRRKDFIAVRTFDEKQAVRADFVDRVSASFRAGAALMRFLARAVDVPY